MVFYTHRKSVRSLHFLVGLYITIKVQCQCNIGLRTHALSIRQPRFYVVTKIAPSKFLLDTVTLHYISIWQAHGDASCTGTLPIVWAIIRGEVRLKVGSNAFEWPSHVLATVDSDVLHSTPEMQHSTTLVFIRREKDPKLWIIPEKDT